jgi:predicted ArsR family transcriptional regulator
MAIMTALELLQQRGPMPVEHIALVLQIEETAVYEELVPAESKGLARVNCNGSGKACEREWEAMEDAT